MFIDKRTKILVIALTSSILTYQAFATDNFLIKLIPTCSAATESCNNFSDHCGDDGDINKSCFENQEFQFTYFDKNTSYSFTGTSNDENEIKVPILFKDKSVDIALLQATHENFILVCEQFINSLQPGTVKVPCFLSPIPKPIPNPIHRLPKAALNTSKQNTVQ